MLEKITKQNYNLMISIECLMVGDYFIAERYYGQILKVFEIKSYGAIRAETLNGGLVGPFFDSDIKPVYLTDEILEKNFPEPDILAWWPTGKDGCYHIEITKDDKEDELGSTEVIIRLKYLHELQHLLRICGIDKKIQL